MVLGAWGVVRDPIIGKTRERDEQPQASLHDLSGKRHHRRNLFEDDHTHD
jgi:hypothetical protein